MRQKMLDLDRDVVSQAWELPAETLDNSPGVRRAVEKIRIAEADVLRPRSNLRADVVDDDIDRNRIKTSLVDRHNRTMPAQMFAPARGIGASDRACRAIGHLQRRVAGERRQASAIGTDHCQSRGHGSLRGPR